MPVTAHRAAVPVRPAQGVDKGWPGVDEPGRVPPHQAGGRAEGYGRQVGDGPVQQHGGGYLRTRAGAGADRQKADQPEFGDADTAGGDGQGREQPDERGRIEGSTAQIMNQYEAMLAAAAAATSTACGHVIACMLAHTLW
jgi:hypothetical protein